MNNIRAILTCLCESTLTFLPLVSLQLWKNSPFSICWKCNFYINCNQLTCLLLFKALVILTGFFDLCNFNKDHVLFILYKKWFFLSKSPLFLSYFFCFYFQNNHVDVTLINGSLQHYKLDITSMIAIESLPVKIIYRVPIVLKPIC